MANREENHYEKVDRYQNYRAVQNRFYEGIAYAEVERCFNSMLGSVDGKTILSIGCGKGDELTKLAKREANIIGIDISENRVNEAASRIASHNLSNVRVLKMDAEDLEFSDSYFDIVIGRAILHHIHLEKGIYEVSRVLKDSGYAVFIEPLGMNPLINLYRKLTPEARSPNEHPLRLNDIKILERYFESVHWKVFHLLTLLSFLFGNGVFFRKSFTFLRKLDSLIAELGFMKRFYWITCIKAIK